MPEMKIIENGRPIRIACIGMGGRGIGQMKVLAGMEDVTVAVVCDVYEDRRIKGRDAVIEVSGYTPDMEADYKAVCRREDIEAVVITTGWETHIPIAIEALNCGKRPAMEVGGANSVQECWDLVHASERTGIPVMLLENCCYNIEELTLLNMVRKGVFGELVHVRGAYAHDLRSEVGNGDVRRHYRQNHFLHRNSELYPTHELGPIAKYLNLNRGNRMVSLCAMASKSAGLNAWFKENRPDSDLVNRRVNEGDVVTTMIRCANGETILLTHDCTLPRPYSRGGVIQGTKGIWQEDNRGIYVEGRTETPADAWTHVWESDKPYMEEYKHPLWDAYEEFGLRGGHGGMDYLVLRAFVESVQRQENPPIDVYDTASWMAITALTEHSIANGSAMVEVPDFTNGRWHQPRKSGVTTIYNLEDEQE